VVVIIVWCAVAGVVVRPGGVTTAARRVGGDREGAYTREMRVVDLGRAGTCGTPGEAG